MFPYFERENTTCHNTAVLEHDTVVDVENVGDVISVYIWWMNNNKNRNETLK